MSKPQRSRGDLEYRTFHSEVRQVSEENQSPKLAGLAVPYNRETVIIPANAMFEGSPEVREMFMPGAMTKTLRESEQWALWAHDANMVLGRKGNGTLRLAETDAGVTFEIDVPDTAVVRDLVVAPVKRGDVNGTSFGFWPLREDSETRDEGKVIVFKVREAGLLEVSPTPMPAYASTSVSSRSMQRVEDALKQLKESAPGGIAAHPDASRAATDTPAAEHPAEEAAPLVSRHLDESLKLRLELARRKR